MLVQATIFAIFVTKYGKQFCFHLILQVEKLKIGPPPECPCKDPKCPKKPVKEEKKEVEPKEDLGQCAMKSKIFFFNVPNHPMPNHPMANAQPLNAPNLQSYSVLGFVLIYLH